MGVLEEKKRNDDSDSDSDSDSGISAAADVSDDVFRSALDRGELSTRKRRQKTSRSVLDKLMGSKNSTARKPKPTIEEMND